MTQKERLPFLLDYFLKESTQAYSASIPEEENAKKRLLRSLMNLRPPKSAPEELLRIQDEYLQDEIQKKGITDGNALPFVQDRISIWQGDITTLRCRAVVNAANASLLGCFVPCHGCIDNAIHTYAGIQLRLACHSIMQKQGFEEPTGQAKITGAYNLPCDFILHTVGPVVKGRLTETDCTLLASCYQSCLELAEEAQIKTIAFCCISTGEFHFPNEQAAEIAVNTVAEYLKNSTIERVIFNVFKDADNAIYKKLLG